MRNLSFWVLPGVGNYFASYSYASQPIELQIARCRTYQRDCPHFLHPVGISPLDGSKVGTTSKLLGRQHSEF